MNNEGSVLPRTPPGPDGGLGLGLGGVRTGWAVSVVGSQELVSDHRSRTRGVRAGAPRTGVTECGGHRVILDPGLETCSNKNFNIRGTIDP